MRSRNSPPYDHLSPSPAYKASDAPCQVPATTLPLLQAHPSAFTTEASCKTTVIHLVCSQSAWKWPPVCLVQRKICLTTHMSVEHLWIKMCNSHHSVQIAEDLLLFNTANCVYRCVGKIFFVVASGAWNYSDYRNDISRLSTLPQAPRGDSFGGAEADGEKVLAWRKWWGTIKGDESIYLYCMNPTSCQTASGKRVVGR